ncbi:MAG: hypothetical protein ACJ0QX_01205 [Gammaproteobacteria bacterium]|tara:strand:- start:48994 stop:49716 length:723 start_codon:yes stop_codon:yes gene_type:complete
MIRLLIMVLTLFLVTLTSHANLYNCKNIYESCFENIPKDMITYHQEVNSHGIVNKNNINLRDIPLISSKNSEVLKKIKKNDKVLIKKVFFLKPNVSVRLRLLNSDKVEIVNNYRFGKWYLVSHGDIEGFIFSDFISVEKKINKKFIRYRHIDSVDWRKNKVDPQKNIELVFKKQNDNAYILQGYAWHYLNGFSEINYTFQNNILSREKIIKDGIKIFLFDENEIFVESDIDIFTGIYKKY